VVAWANDSGPALAVALTCLAVVGPWLASKALTNPRHVSVVFGVTAMYVGALLVHFGRGLWTIEMHFYFFVSLALLAVFANPTVIVVAAVTVALHHALFWAVLPESVFNYDAPLSTVVVHATFVVLESVAACFVARSFFDNVIGLDRIVQARTAELDEQNRQMALVLDNVSQGFLTARPDGGLFERTSAVVHRWLGAPQDQQKVWDLFGRVDRGFGEMLRLGWEALLEDILPRDLLLAQLPSTYTSGQRTFTVEYQPIEVRGELAQVLVVITDATERIARERADAIQRETVAVFERVSRDRHGFVEFFEEATARVAELAAEPNGLDAAGVARAVHTLKGNCALFGLQSVAAACHEVEERSSAAGEPIDEAGRHRVRDAWGEASRRLIQFLGDRTAGLVEVEEADLFAVLVAIRDGRSREEIAECIARWRQEPTRRRLRRMAEQAEALAGRMGLGPIEVVVTDHRLRLPRDPLVPFWSTLVHVVRNAVDHGLGSADGPRRLVLETSCDELGRTTVAVVDNGRGIDWERVRASARMRDLPAETREDLVEALFADGVTTRAELTELSGRGVGLAAVARTCRSLGAEIRVESPAEGGRGTRFSFTLPAELSRAAA
jgi:HPt (histidine-containing phosphotransfer) domain-containing protein